MGPGETAADESNRARWRAHPGRCGTDAIKAQTPLTESETAWRRVIMVLKECSHFAQCECTERHSWREPIAAIVAAQGIGILTIHHFQTPSEEYWGIEQHPHVGECPGR
jgi:hypothetical protein